MKGPKVLRLAAMVVLLALCTGTAALAAIIDPGVPPGHTSTGPLELPVPYQFNTSWDDIEWTADQKESARSAINYLGGFFVQQPAFEEEPGSSDDFSIRWAGSDLFKDWGTYNGEDWDYSNALAMAVKPRPDNTTPWDQNTYPYNEIYINSTFTWHYNPFTPPGSDEYDFWSVLLHEVIHMLCVDEHAEHEDEVMYESIGAGERKWELKESDRQLLREAGYDIVPEPAAVLIWIMMGLLIVRVGHRRRAA